MDAIRLEHHLNAENIITTMLKRWLQGKTTIPVTWCALVDVLRKSNLNVLADQIQRCLRNEH